jgi:hypothetical protein
MAVVWRRETMVHCYFYKKKVELETGRFKITLYASPIAVGQGSGRLATLRRSLTIHNIRVIFPSL